MAYVNVLDWKAEQVADWLRGLEDTVYPYAHFFLNNDVTGQGLLNLTVDDLYKLHVEKLGHQEIILESLELLRNFHYNLDQENLQYISLRLSCKARSLFNEMCMKPVKAGEKQVVVAPVMASVADVLESVRQLLSWLERKPFDRSDEYHGVRTTLISLSLELATNAQRDTFAETPLDVIKSCCDKLGNLADKVIQEFTDSLILQPASLDVATVRKRADEELGIVVESPQPGIHLVTEVRMLNPSARLEAGDEIVQVNYQTIVGWQNKKVVQLMAENPVELILTLKKRPRHSNLGQIYMKPFRIPTRKKSGYYINNLPSPRTELLVVPDVSLPILQRARHPSDSSSDLPLSDTEEEDSEDDEAFLPVAAAEVAGQIQRQSTASPTASLRSVLSRPRSAPQRRATISGTSPSQYRSYINVSEIWTGLRDTSVDFPSSTLSSKDSGRSTMSSSKKSPEKNPTMEKERPELRQRSTPGGAAARPITITASSFFPTVTSAPNLASLNSPAKVVNNGSEQKTNTCLRTPEFKAATNSRGSAPRPRMPEPPSELPGELVNVIHVPSPAPPPTTPPYMNLPKRDVPEYVDMTEYDEMPDEVQAPKKPQYVNVPLDPTGSTSRQPLPKPRAARGSTGTASEGGFNPSVSQQHPSAAAAAHQHPTSPAQQQQQSAGQQAGGGGGQHSPAGRGKRPVPLPRRLPSLSSPTTNSSSKATLGQPPVRLHASNSLSAAQPPTPGASSSTTQQQQPESGPPSSRAQVQSSRGSNPRRRSSTAEVPTPTANFKSYRRVLPSEVQRRSSCTEEGPGSARQRLAPPPPRATHNQPLHHSSKSMTRLPQEKPTITRLPQDQQTPVRHQLPSRTDSGIGSDSMRHSSISSVDSGHGSFPTSPVRQAAVMVRSPGARPTASDFLRRQSSSSSTTSSQSAALDAEKRNRRRSAVVRGTSEDSSAK